jgi:hypothetical protein
MTVDQRAVPETDLCFNTMVFIYERNSILRVVNLFVLTADGDHFYEGSKIVSDLITLRSASYSLRSQTPPSSQYQESDLPLLPDRFLQGSRRL